MGAVVQWSVNTGGQRMAANGLDWQADLLASEGVAQGDAENVVGGQDGAAEGFR